MKASVKAIVVYIFQWLVCFLFCDCMYDAYQSSFGNSFNINEADFYYGAAFGISLFMVYVMLLMNLLPVYKLIVSRIKRQHTRFIDILVVK